MLTVSLSLGISDKMILNKSIFSFQRDYCKKFTISLLFNVYWISLFTCFPHFACCTASLLFSHRLFCFSFPRSILWHFFCFCLFQHSFTIYYVYISWLIYLTVPILFAVGLCQCVFDIRGEYSIRLWKDLVKLMPGCDVLGLAVLFRFCFVYLTYIL